MNIADRIREKAGNLGIKQLAKMSERASKKIAQDMMQLERQIIVVQKNQVETEDYLKKILKLLEDGPKH